MIDLDDSTPTVSTSGANDLSGLFSYTAQPAQVNIMAHAQAPAQYQPPPLQQQQQQQPSYAPTPLFYNNNSNMGTAGGMNAFMQTTAANSMTPHRQLSSTPPASIALPQSKPGSQRSTPAPAVPAPNYFGNAGARGPIGIGVNRGGMNLSNAMSGMSLNGGGSQGPPPQSTAPAPAPASAPDPFADLAGLF